MTPVLLALLLAATPSAPARTQAGDGAAPGGDGAPARTAGRAAAAAAPDLAELDREHGPAGTRWRFVTENGAIHAFRPRGYDPATAGTLVYLHGYYTDVDEAWEQHRLAEQFRASARNALFVAAESPVNNPDTVKWTDLAALLARVRLAGVPVPEGPVVVMAHSGGFRTVVPWLASGRIEQLVLLDALYNNLPDFEAWLASAPPDQTRRILLVGFETLARGEQLAVKFDGALTREALPERLSQFSREERAAPLLSIRSQYGHMEMVTEGLVIPMVLRLTGLKPL